MDNILPNGTEVLVFPYIDPQYENKNNYNFKKGIIITSTNSEDLSYHGTSWYKRIYYIKTEDNKDIIAVYGHPSQITNNYIRTKNDHIDHLMNQALKNQNKVLELLDENEKIQSTITSLIESPKHKQL